MLFDPDISNHSLLPVSPSYLLIRHICGVTLHMLSLVCIAREFFLSWEKCM
ncbi:unnamed protein product [Staurois parvus]|uniref:Uncharacterized protein n=1 Tax=Staurois parvus TaxID=386267 RepID=A0ABN9CHC9_9NEOB|nr:unnamed protein product [Staurois parvus]